MTQPEAGLIRRCLAGDEKAYRELGEVYQIVTRRQGPFPARISDVGVVKDLATHDIDLTAWVAQQRFESVAARVAHRSGRAHEDLVADLYAFDMPKRIGLEEFAGFCRTVHHRRSVAWGAAPACHREWKQ